MKQQWTKQQAQAWYQQQGWLCGFNYLPSTAVNWTDIWQKETFDAATIDRELGWAADAGYNSLRINLPFIVWENDRDGLIARIHHFFADCRKPRFSHHADADGRLRFFRRRTLSRPAKSARAGKTQQPGRGESRSCKSLRSRRMAED